MSIRWLSQPDQRKQYTCRKRGYVRNGEVPIILATIIVEQLIEIHKQLYDPNTSKNVDVQSILQKEGRFGIHTDTLSNESDLGEDDWVERKEHKATK